MNQEEVGAEVVVTVIEGEVEIVMAISNMEGITDRRKIQEMHLESCVTGV